MQIRMNLPNSINWKSGVPAKVADSNTSSESILNVPPVRTRSEDQKLINNAVKTLTTEQKQKLKDKYDIHNMPVDSPEHEALMKELRDLGAISDDDYITTGSTLIHVHTPYVEGSGLSPGQSIRSQNKAVYRVGDGTNDIYTHYFHGQDGFMESYAQIITSNALPFDHMMKIADTQLTQSRAFGRIADVLKDIFM